MIDIVNGTVLVSAGLFAFLVGLAVFGLLIAGAMFAVAIATYAQRQDNIREIKRYNAMVGEIRDINKMWYGNPNSETDVAFTGLSSMVNEMEFLEERD